MPAPNLRAGLAAAQKFAAKLAKLPPGHFDTICRSFLKRVVLQERQAAIEIAPDGLMNTIFANEPEGTRTISPNGETKTGAEPLTIDCEFQIRHWSNELRLVIPGSEGDEPTPPVKTIARAHLWYERIVAGEAFTLDELATRAKLSAVYASRIFRYASLSPRIVECFLEGSGDSEIGPGRLHSRLPLEWEKQSLQVRS